MTAPHHCGELWDRIQGHACFCPIGHDHSTHDHAKDFASSDCEEAR